MDSGKWKGLWRGSASKTLYRATLPFFAKEWKLWKRFDPELYHFRYHPQSSEFCHFGFALQQGLHLLWCCLQFQGGLIRLNITKTSKSTNLPAQGPPRVDSPKLAQLRTKYKAQRPSDQNTRPKVLLIQKCGKLWSPSMILGKKKCMHLEWDLSFQYQYV